MSASLGMLTCQMGLMVGSLTRPPNLLQNYLPSQEGVAHSQFVKMMVIFSVAFITVLILKVSGPCARLWEGWGGSAVPGSSMLDS